MVYIYSVEITRCTSNRLKFWNLNREVLWLMRDLNFISQNIKNWTSMQNNENDQNIDNSIAFLYSVNDRINIERKNYIGEFWDLQDNIEIPKDQLLICSIQPLISLFIKTYVKVVDWCKRISMKNQNINKLFQMSISVSNDSSVISNSELSIFMNNLWQIALEGDDISKASKDNMSALLDELLKHSCMSMDSAYQILSAMPKLNLK